MTDDRYRITGDVVHDTTTGLEWQREHSGPMMWDEAVKYAARRGDGWRLPMVEELIALIDFTHYEPASEFPTAPGGYYWSSSSCAGSASSAWYVSFYNGFVYHDDKTGTYYVRCVRRPVVGPSDLGRLDALEQRVAALEARARKTIKPQTKAGRKG